VTVGRYGAGPSFTVVGVTNNPGFPVGSRWPLDGPSMAKTVFDEARAARIDDYSDFPGTIAAAVRSTTILSAVGSPILVDGSVWGYISVSATDSEPLPADTEERLEEFTELVATAIGNAQAREELRLVAEEQAALRRVATLVAKEDSPTELFAKVAEEAGVVLGNIDCVLWRDAGDGTAIVVASSGEAISTGFPVGTQVPVDGDGVAASVLRQGQPHRIDDYSAAVDPLAQGAGERGIRSAVGCPIVVRGDIWGVIVVATSGDEPCPPETERRLAQFADLVATAISNAAARGEIERLADDQAALRRVATLVAQGVAPDSIFSAVCEEVGRLLGADITALETFWGDGTSTMVALWSAGGPTVPVGRRLPLRPDSVAAQVLSTRAPVRRDRYDEAAGEVGKLSHSLGLTSTVGAPILVGGRLWGALLAGTRRTGPWAKEAETRLAGFAGLVATAIVNAESRDALARLAHEQASLRRVATLVARDAPPGEVFDAVAMEVGKLLDTDITVVGRYDGDGAATAIGSWSASPGGVPVGTRSVLGGRNVLTLVAETEKPARVDGYDDASGEAADIARRHGWSSSIAAPIIVEGRLWGVMLVATQRREPFPAGAEEQLSAFTDLVATAIANAEAKSEVAASRRRIVAAADEARRRIERDLHDGIQQRLIALTFRARAIARNPTDELPARVEELSEGLKDVSEELREVSRGIHPTILTEAGLGPALRALARRSNVPIDVDVNLDERLPEPIEAAAYYIASEALTNVEKHAQADVVQLIAAHDDRVLTLEVRDDGVGGVDAGRGSGILGLTDRVEALGGTISITSPPRVGTTLSVRLPITA